MANSDSIEYRQVEGYPGYRVGNDGSIWSCWRYWFRGARLSDQWKILKPWARGAHYPRVVLCSPTGRQKISVHQIVLSTFVGPCPDGLICRHLNGCPQDNRLANLAWGTQEQNVQDCRDHERIPEGEKCWRATTTTQQVLNIRARYATIKGTRKRLSKGELVRLAKECGVTKPAIKAIVGRRTWKHLD